MSKQRPSPPSDSSPLNPAPIIAAVVVLAVIGVLIFTMLNSRPGSPATGSAPVFTAVPDVAGAAPGATAGAAPEQTAAPAAQSEPTPAAATTAASQAAPAGARKSYAAMPPMSIDPKKSYTATIDMANGGQIVLKLRPDLAPQTVSSFVFLAKEGFYDGLTFHRVEPGFVIQGGDPDGTGTGGPGYSIPAEFTDKVLFDKPGLLAMARASDPNSGGSQFFITLGPAPHLNNQYTVFGEVVSGQDVAEKVKVGDVMQKVTITEG